MSWQTTNTLWGIEVLNPAPRCSENGCDNYADNAGNGRYHLRCSMHHKKKYKMLGWNYKLFRKDFCENIDGRLGYRCTTTIVKPNWQLEVDHIDGDRYNKSVENYQTLCSCCHRYKTYINEENLSPEKRKKKLVESMT